MPAVEYPNLTANRIAADQPWDTRSGMLKFTALAYDDVFIVPQYSGIEHRKDFDSTTQLVPGLTLRIPVISANMDTVTGHKMAIMMAQLGGIGVLNRNMTIADQSNEIKKVKHALQYVIYNPPWIYEDDPVGLGLERMVEGEIPRGFVLIRKRADDKLAGIMTQKNILRAHGDMSKVASTIMTTKIISAPPETSIEQAQFIMHENEIEKLVFMDSNGDVAGVVADRDLRDLNRYPNATKDSFGRLRVGASVGVRDPGEAAERAKESILSGADVIFVDAANGATSLTEKSIKKQTASIAEIEFDVLTKLNPVMNRLHNTTKMVSVVAGNTATPETTERVIGMGADGVKAGISSGGSCKTRTETGVGVPQFSAVVYSADVASRHGVTLIADGGIRQPGHVAIALGAGADTVMIGSMLAGTDQAPGEAFPNEKGDMVKHFRGSSSRASRKKLLESQGLELDKKNEVNAEGIETTVPFKGDAEPIINALAHGVDSSASYSNSRNLAEYQNKVIFGQQTRTGFEEGNPHVKSGSR